MRESAHTCHYATCHHTRLTCVTRHATQELFTLQEEVENWLATASGLLERHREAIAAWQAVP
eukprot:COSAG02_NODE_61243_length_269_cov_0.611765_1_plen_61_part_10